MFKNIKYIECNIIEFNDIMSMTNNQIYQISLEILNRQNMGFSCFRPQEIWLPPPNRNDVDVEDWFSFLFNLFCSSSSSKT